MSSSAPHAPHAPRDPLCLAACVVLGLSLPPGLPAPLVVLALVVWLAMRRRHAALALGLLAGWWATSAAPSLPATERAQLQVEVRGATEVHGDRRRCRVIARATRDGTRLPPTELVLDEAASADERRRGELLEARGRLSPPGFPRNPGDELEPARLRCTAGSVRRLAAAPWWRRWREPLDELRRGGLQRLDATLSPASAALGAALLFGDRRQLPEELRESLRSTGSAHLFALSGLHVGLVAALLDRILHALGVRSVGPRMLGLVVAALASGGAPPVLRATTAVCLWWWSASRGRRVGFGGPFAWALIAAALSFGPDQRISLCLSFSAVLGIAAGSRQGPRFSPRHWRSGQAPWIRPARGLWMGICATAATAPFAAAFFGRVGPWSPLSTLLLVAFLVPWIVLSLLALAAASLLPEAVPLLDRCLAGSLALAGDLLALLDRLPGTPVVVPRPGPSLLVAHGAALLAWARGHRAIAASLATLGLGLWSRIPAPPPALHLLDVGHGQCLVWRDGATDLVDVGAPSAWRLERTLDALHVDALRLVFVSHLDHDHCRGLAELARRRSVGTVVLSGAQRAEWEAASSPSLRELRDVLRQRAVPVLLVRAGWQCGGWRVHWPPAGRSFAQRNEGSLALSRAQGDGRRWLLPGDLQGFPLLELASGWGDAVDGLILPHHGNPDPGLPMLLERSRPRWVVASRGAPLPPLSRQQLEARGLSAISTSHRGAIHRAERCPIRTGPDPPGRSWWRRLGIVPTPVTGPPSPN